MARMIDADKYPCNKCEKSYCYVNCNDFKAWFNDTVDAVPVVRCKDCIHYKKVKGAINGWCECDYIPFDTDPEDFCSFGERKTNA